MHVKNEALANQELADGAGGIYKGDAYGVFTLPDKFAKELLATPGFVGCRMTAESAVADKDIEKAEKRLKQAEVALEAAKEAAVVARAQADLGNGTALDPEEEGLEDPEGDQDDNEAPEGEEGEEEAEEATEEGEEGAESETAEQIAAGETPNMKWKSDRLIKYCQALNIAADSNWTKAQCLTEIDELEDE